MGVRMALRSGSEDRRGVASGHGQEHALVEEEVEQHR